MGKTLDLDYPSISSSSLHKRRTAQWNIDVSDLVFFYLFIDFFLISTLLDVKWNTFFYNLSERGLSCPPPLLRKPDFCSLNIFFYIIPSVLLSALPASRATTLSKLLAIPIDGLYLIYPVRLSLYTILFSLCVPKISPILFWRVIRISFEFLFSFKTSPEFILSVLALPSSRR